MSGITQVTLQYDKEAPVSVTMPVSTSLAVALTAFNEVMSFSYNIKSSVPLPSVTDLDCTNSPADDEAYVAQTGCVYDSIAMYTLHWRKMPPGDLAEIEDIYNLLFYLTGHEEVKEVY